MNNCPMCFGHHDEIYEATISVRRWLQSQLLRPVSTPDVPSEHAAPETPSA